MLIISVNGGAHAIVPYLHRPIMVGAQYPRALWMERKSLDPTGLCLKLYQHGMIIYQSDLGRSSKNMKMIFIFDYINLL